MKRMIFPVIKKYKKLLISVMLVSAMGCGFMSGLSSAYTSLQRTLDGYVEDYHYPDAMITTTVTNRNMIDKLKQVDAVSEINARLCGDTYLKSPQGRYLSVRVFTYNPDDSMQFHYWSKKSSIENEDEILLEYNFAEDNGISVGQTVKIKVDQEYREYFVAGTVTNPETLAVQPMDDSWGSNNDFGYAYAPVSLLSKEYEQKYGDAKKELDGKQEELDKGWGETEQKLSDAEQQLEDAKKQLAESKETFSSSYQEAQEKLTQLTETETELNATKTELVSKKEELQKTKETLRETGNKLYDNISTLNEAAEGIKEIDEALETIDNLSQLSDDKHISRFISLMSAYPDYYIDDLVEITDLMSAFLHTAETYGYTYDATDSVQEISDSMKEYMDQVMSDKEYVHSEQFDDLSSISDEERDKLTEIMKRYDLYNSQIPFEECFENTKYTLDSLADTIEENALYSVVAFLPEAGSSDSLEELVSGITTMTNYIDTLSEYTGETIETTGDLASVYSSSVGQLDQKKTELKTKRTEILDSLSEYGVTEEDLSDVTGFVVAKQKTINESIDQIDEGITQINDAMTQIEDSLRQIAEGRETIQTKIEDAEKQLTDAESEISQNEETYVNERSKALSEFDNLKDELEKAVKQLNEGESYAMLCNQFLVYFKDGADPDAALEELKGILAGEEVEVKSNYTYENSAVKQRINDNLKTIETLSILTPSIFFGIILIVVFLFMSLIIKQSRREIGILRALGFTKGNIRALYCSVNFITSLMSIVLGTVMGYVLMLYVGNYFRNFFPLFEFTYQPNLLMYLFSAGLTIVVGLISTIISTGSISKVMPSEAMSRPAPETATVPKLLERLIVKASPMTKFSVTTLFRNKMRFVFSVICIAASVMMIFSSFAFITSKNYMLHQLYGERIHYDCQIYFKEDPDEAFMKEMNDQEYVRNVQKMPFYQSDITFKGKSEKALINAVQTDTELIGIYDSSGKKLTVPEDGIMLERHLAEKLGVQKGDTVSINGKDIRIESISEQSIARSQYVSYQTGKTLGDITLGCIICNISEDDEQRLISFLTKNDNYLYSVFTRMALQANEKTFKTYDLAAWIIIVFAIIIGLIIVINTAQTNLLEKKRELCVLRTLGFQQSEISRKWFVQSLLQFIFSCAVGLPTGIVIAKLALQKLGNESREYIFANHFTEYLLTILLVLGYVVVSHLIAMRTMKKWDLVESVKDKE